MPLHRRALALLTTLVLVAAVACGPAPESDAAQEADSASMADTAAAAAGEDAQPEPTAGTEEGEDAGTPEPAPAQRERFTLAAGVQMTTTLDDSLDTETLEAGAPFTATVSEPVVQDRHVVVPGGSRVYGRVTEVRQPDGDRPGLIRLAMDSIRVREIASPLAAEITDTELAMRGEMKDEAEKIGGGAAAGALIGAIVGKDVKGAVIGAAAGAAAGTAVALGTKAQYAVLPKGSRLTLRLTEPLEVAAPE